MNKYIEAFFVFYRSRNRIILIIKNANSYEDIIISINKVKNIRD